MVLRASAGVSGSTIGRTKRGVRNPGSRSARTTLLLELAALLSEAVRRSSAARPHCTSSGRGGMPALCWKLKDGVEGDFTLYDFADRLRTRGWQVPAYAMPAERSDLVIQRILVRHGVSRDLGCLLLDDIRRTLDHFAAHPVDTPLTEDEAGGNNHTGRQAS